MLSQRDNRPFIFHLYFYEFLTRSYYNFSLILKYVFERDSMNDLIVSNIKTSITI